MFKLVVLSVVLAVGTASPIGIWGGLATPLNAGIVTPIGAPIAASVAAVPFGNVAPIGAYNYRGPLSLAPDQPANILAVDGRPLDTLSVNQDRGIHYTAKAVEGHLLKKRSIGVSQLIAAPLAAAPWTGAGVIASPLTTSPLAVSQSARLGIPAAHVVNSAPVAITASGPIAPLGLQLGTGLAQLW